tara:strand:+ start:9516 stop:10703 length:1188 start_codon:yes stop_codon:yes gene_type:complete
MAGSDKGAGELTVEKGKIRFIGDKAPDDFNGETIDLSNCLVMPGFVNAHCHLTLSALKGKLSPTDSFTDWVLALLELENSLSDQESLEACYSRVEEMLHSGVTTFADYLGRTDLLPRYADFPLRQMVFLEAIGFQSDRAEEIGKRIETVLRNGSPAPGRISLGVAPHAPYSTSPALFQLLYKIANDYGVPVSSHVGELVEENEFLQRGSGKLRRLLDQLKAYDISWRPPKKSSLEYLIDLNAIESLVAVHLNHIDVDANLLTNYRMSAVFCPRSTRWFRRGKYMNVKGLLGEGISIGLGTDSLASNENLNFLDELRAAESMASDLSRDELLVMATRGGAQALKMDVGVAAAGWPADLIAFRIESLPERWSDIIFDPTLRKVDFSMIGGEILINKP